MFVEKWRGGSWVSHCPSQKFDMKIEAGTSVQRPGSISQNVIAVFVGCRTMTFPAAPCNENHEGTSFTSIEMFHTHTHPRTHTHTHVHTHMHTYTCIHTYRHYMYMFMYLYENVNICICICISISICKCI